MSNGDIENSLKYVGETMRQQPSVRDAVMRRVTEAAVVPPVVTPAPWSRRRMIARLAAVAACAVIATILWGTWGGGGGLGAQQAFAAAIANVEKARTFSARKIHRWVEDGREQMSESQVKFREPDRERLEHVTGLHPEPEVMITDYKARLRLQLYPDRKTAQMQDISTLYAVDDNTGRVNLSQLSTRERDDVLKISAQAVKDLGIQKLDGRDARVLRSADEKEPVKTVWVEPKTGKPVQIELSWPSRKASFTYASIRIDEVLDETLFELDMPPGYAMIDGDAKPKKYIDEINGKMLSKARNLVMACYKYADKKGDFPADIRDLKGVVMQDAALKALLATPDEPEGPPVLLYRQPRKGTDSGKEIVVFEAPEHRRPGQVVTGFWDGHSQILLAEEFEQLMK